MVISVISDPNLQLRMEHPFLHYNIDRQPIVHTKIQYSKDNQRGVMIMQNDSHKWSDCVRMRLNDDAWDRMWTMLGGEKA